MHSLHAMVFWTGNTLFVTMCKFSHATLRITVYNVVNKHRRPQTVAQLLLLSYRVHVVFILFQLKFSSGPD